MKENKSKNSRNKATDVKRATLTPEARQKIQEVLDDYICPFYAFKPENVRTIKDGDISDTDLKELRNGLEELCERKYIIRKQEFSMETLGECVEVWKTEIYPSWLFGRNK